MMDPTLEAAIERVKEQDEEINDLHILLDLEREAHTDTKTLLRVAKAQIAMLKNDRTYAVG